MYMWCESCEESVSAIGKGESYWGSLKVVEHG